jgi:hypothetical protein
MYLATFWAIFSQTHLVTLLVTVGLASVVDIDVMITPFSIFHTLGIKTVCFLKTNVTSGF